MSTLDNTRSRLKAVQDEVRRLKESEFPYRHPYDALQLLEKLFADQQTVLAKVSPSAPQSVIHNACSTSLYQLFVYMPILGFILRSTNVRNAFEYYWPILRLARTALKPDARLIISSEWDYSPFVYRAMKDLPGYALIGLPASETSNPLLLPLAGHELGHAVWETEGVDLQFTSDIEKGVVSQLITKHWTEYSALYPQYKPTDLNTTDMFIRSTWVQAFIWASFQAEELFCDFYALRLFSESYLHAFAYLLAPGGSGTRTLHYPSMTRRVRHLEEAATALHVQIPQDFAAGFTKQQDPAEPATRMLVAIADDVSESLVPRLIDAARKAADSKVVPQRDDTKVARIVDDFTKVIPTGESHSLSDIVNAGWNCAMQPNLWQNIPQIRAEDKDRILYDLILKSMEVAEVYVRIGSIP